MSDHLPKISLDFYKCLSCWEDSTVQAFIKGYRQLFLSIANAFNFPLHEREDFVGDCFLRVSAVHFEYDKTLGDLWPWVATIGWNHGRNYSRKLARRSAREGELTVDPRQDKNPAPVDLMIEKEKLDQVLQIIEALRTKARTSSGGMRSQTIEIGMTMTMGGLSPTETAELFGVTVENATLSRWRFLQEVKKRLPKNVVELDAQKSDDVEPDDD